MACSPLSNPLFVSPQTPASANYSLTYSLRCQSKIADLSYRLGYISNLLSSVTEILDLVHSQYLDFEQYQEQIIVLAELARKTLESSEVVPYLWASCPKQYLSHKSAYIDLLRMLQSNEQYVVDKNLQKRLRSLLMPLTSKFEIRCPSQYDTPAGPSIRPEHYKLPSRTSPPTSDYHSHPNTSSSTDAESSSMLPPDAFPAVNQQSHNSPSGRRSSGQRFWHESEVLASPERKSRSRSPHRRSDTASADDDQENVVPEPVAFYHPPARQRFGIFCTGRSSMLGNYNRGRPTH